MEDIRIQRRLAAQDGVVASWQLRADGVGPAAIARAAKQWRAVHDAVYVDGHGRVTPHQRLLIASLTTARTAVEGYSAAWFYGLRPRDDGPVTVVRPGSGGLWEVESRLLGEDGKPVRELGLKVRRSKRLPDDDIVRVDGLRVTSAARTVLDMVARARSPSQQGRLVREALRLGIVTPEELHAVVARHPGERGVRALRGLLDRYARLPLTQAKSDAESAALAVLHEAGLSMPRVNVLVAGHEADFSWVAQRYLLELDSDEYHPFPEHDEIKQAAWERAGWLVDHLPTNVAETAPGLLIETVRAGLSTHALARRLRRAA